MPDYPSDIRFPMKFMKFKVPDFHAEMKYQEIDHAHTEVLVDKRDKKICLQLPPNYNSPFLKFQPKDDFDHKVRIANEMLKTYMKSEEGSSLNIEPAPGGFFDGAEVRTEGNISIAQNNPDYFRNLRSSDLNTTETRSFVKYMEYLPEKNRIEINIDQCEYTFKECVIEPPTPAEIRFETRQRIKSNLTIITPSRTRLITSVPKNEQVAMETLREAITEMEYRKYIKDGFILVKGRSGRVYQIFRDKHHTKVWEKGKVVEEVCVRIKTSFNVPPTDNVIAFRTLVLYSEEEFKKLGNVYKRAA